MGVCLQSLCFSYLWLVLCCIDSGVRKTSTDLWRMQKDVMGQSHLVVYVEQISSAKISPSKDASGGSAGIIYQVFAKSALWVTNVFMKAYIGFHFCATERLWTPLKLINSGRTNTSPFSSNCIYIDTSVFGGLDWAKMLCSRWSFPTKPSITFW